MDFHGNIDMASVNHEQMMQVWFFAFTAWRSVMKETTSPCALCVTECAATGNCPLPAARHGPATCSTMRPPSSSPSLWHCGVSRFYFLASSLVLLTLYTNCCVLYILRVDMTGAVEILCPGFGTQCFAFNRTRPPPPHPSVLPLLRC